LKRLYISLKSLDDNYSDEKALSVIREVVESSILPIRKKVLDKLIEFYRSGQTSTTEYMVSRELRIGRKTVYSELNILWNLGILNMEAEEILDHYDVEVRGEGYKTKSLFYYPQSGAADIRLSPE